MECAHRLVEDVFLRFGFPRKLISDNDVLRAVCEVNETEQARQKHYADQRRRGGPEFDPGDKVWVAIHVKSDTDYKITSKFVPKRDGPYIVKHRIFEISYE
ncbi:hypothetical protein BDFB_013013, partial [Asbolus verrucosus]